MEQTTIEKIETVNEWEHDLNNLVRKCKANWNINFDDEVKDIVNALYGVEEIVGEYREKLCRRV